MDRSQHARGRAEAVCPRSLSVLGLETFRSVVAKRAGYAGDKAVRRSIQPSRSSVRFHRHFVSNDNVEDRSTSEE